MRSSSPPTAFAAACGRPTSAAVTADAAPQAIVVANVETHELRRAIDVVGTLAADEEVTVSSEAEGRVRRIAADLGDRVTAGQALVELDPEKLQYTLDQQRAALARALARYGAPESAAAARRSSRRPTCRRPPPSSRRRSRRSDRADELHKRQLLPQQTLDDADATLSEEGGLRLGAAERAATCAPTSTRSSATMKLAERAAARRRASARRSTATSRSGSCRSASSSRPDAGDERSSGWIR